LGDERSGKSINEGLWQTLQWANISRARSDRTPFYSINFLGDFIEENMWKLFLRWARFIDLFIYKK